MLGKGAEFEFAFAILTPNAYDACVSVVQGIRIECP